MGFEDSRTGSQLLKSLMYRAIRGTKDILPDEVGKWQLMERKAAQVFSLYGFREIRTPIFEETDLFARGIGTSTDIVNKEMYTFRMGHDSITLRPENTAPVVRAYIQHSLHRKGVGNRYYYVGPMFRYERPQKGRQRQFHQIGVEVLGEQSPLVDAEVIEMSVHFLDSIGVSGYKTTVNSVGCPECRKEYRHLLRNFLRSFLPKLCEDCKRRYDVNPLRVFDCKVESCRRIFERAPVLIDSLCEECTSDFERVKNYLGLFEIDYSIEPRLVRGLDYYVKTAYEIYSQQLGSQNSILGGGRYDGLIEELGGPRMPGFGFAAGMERIIMLMPEGKERDEDTLHIYIATTSELGFIKGIALCKALRRKGLSVSMATEMKSLNIQMRNANRENAAFVIFLGDEELKSGKAGLKDMKSGEQREILMEEIGSVFERILNG